MTNRNHIARHYSKWGYIFAIPFALVFLVFHLWPLGSTLYYSVCELKHAGNTNPIFLPTIGEPLLKNFGEVFKSTSFKDALRNTFVFWIGATIPEWILAFWLAATVTDRRLKIKGRWLFKTSFLLPQLITSSTAAGTILTTIASLIGFVYVASMINGFGYTDEDMEFFFSVKFLVIVVYMFMHFGITFIYAVAGITGIPVEVFEAAEIDGADRWKTFFHITVPCMKPIMFFITVISVIDGIAMVEVPSWFGIFDTSRKALTLMQYLQNQAFMGSYIYDRASAASVVLLGITAILAGILYFVFLWDKDEAKARRLMKKELKAMKKAA